MRFRRGLLSCVGLLLVVPVSGEAQTRSPMFERVLPKAVATPVSSTSVDGIQASGTRSGRRDSLINGTVIGAAVGAALGIAFTHATRDSELEATQYAYGALIFGGIGAGVGVGIDALLDRGRTVVPPSSRRVAVNTNVTRKAARVRLVMRW